MHSQHVQHEWVVVLGSWVIKQSGGLSGGWCVGNLLSSTAHKLVGKAWRHLPLLQVRCSWLHWWWQLLISRMAAAAVDAVQALQAGQALDLQELVEQLPALFEVSVSTDTGAGAGVAMVGVGRGVVFAVWGPTTGSHPPAC